MRQIRELLRLEHAGQTVEIFDPTTGEVRRAPIFVAVLGASSDTYVEATEDRAKAEVGVQTVERSVLAELRNRRFTSPATLNQAIFQSVGELNRKPSRHLGASRLEMFRQTDRPALSPLPAETYGYDEWTEVFGSGRLTGAPSTG